MARIRLTGKCAIGQHRYAIVDDDLFPALKRYKWKAKPNQNGTQVYAVRNTQVGSSSTMLRMHREVIGVSSVRVLAAAEFGSFYRELGSSMPKIIGL